MIMNKSRYKAATAALAVFRTRGSFFLIYTPAQTKEIIVNIIRDQTWF